MARQTEQLEREAEETRRQLAGALGELRTRLSPGQVVDQAVDYAREGSAADFLRNLAREVRENPIPVLLIATGVLWLFVASSRSQPIMSALERDIGMTRPTDIASVAAAPVEKSSERTRELASASVA